MSGDAKYYEDEDTPMGHYAFVHAQLEARRNKIVGPRVLVVGSGKTTLCRILCSYALRAGRKPILVDLDVRGGFPGCVQASVMEVLTTCSQTRSASSVVYHFGHCHPSVDPNLYRTVIETVAGHVDLRHDADPASNSAGIIVDTCTEWDDVEHCVREFSIDIVLVAGVSFVGIARMIHSTAPSVYRFPVSH